MVTVVHDHHDQIPKDDIKSSFFTMNFRGSKLLGFPWPKLVILAFLVLIGLFFAMAALVAWIQKVAQKYVALKAGRTKWCVVFIMLAEPQIHHNRIRFRGLFDAVWCFSNGFFW